MLLLVTDAKEIGERFPSYQARLAERLPTVNEVNREQVELLRRYRVAQDEAAKEAIKIPLLLSISCIAAGLAPRIRV